MPEKPKPRKTLTSLRAERTALDSSSAFSDIEEIEEVTMSNVTVELKLKDKTTKAATRAATYAKTYNAARARLDRDTEALSALITKTAEECTQENH